MEWLVGLNSLRFFAIVLILIYHLASKSLPGGFVAVELFFVISGFLVCSKLIAEYKREGKIFYGKFIAHRLKRVYPPLLACIAVTLLLSLALHPDLIVGIRGKLVAALTLTSNLQELLVGGSYENSFTPNLFGHLWFLALDVQLCLVAPLIITLVLRIFGTRKKGIRALLVVFSILALASGALMMVYGGMLGYGDRAYFAPDTHAMAFCVGAAVAAFTHLYVTPPRFSGWRLLVALFCSIVTIAIFALKTTYSAQFTFLAVLPLVALLSGICLMSMIYLQRSGKTKQIMAKILMPLEFAGSMSFGLYLFHWPAAIVLPRIFQMSDMLFYTMCIALSIVLALLAPIITNALAKRPKARSVAALAVVVLAVCVCIRAPQQSAIAESLELQETAEMPIATTTPDYIGYRKVMQETERVILREFELSNGAQSIPSRSYTAAESPSVAKVLVIGDSVTLGAKEAIESTIPSSFVDAKESRGIESAAPILAAYSMEGELPNIIVVSLITNERTITDSLLQGIIDVGGNQRKYVFVTGYAGTQQPRETQNAAVVAFAEKHSNVVVADWWGMAHDNWSLMYADHIHLNPEGRIAYADLIYNTIRRGL